MLLHDIALHLKLILIAALTYGISVTFAGAFKAWVAKKSGDSTAEHEGYLTLDPIAHIDPFGLFFLTYTMLYTRFPFGWGKYVPVNPYQISGPWRDAKIMATYYADMGIHLLFTVIAMLVMPLLAILAINGFAQADLLVTITSIFLQFNSMLGVLRFIQNSVLLASIHFIERHPSYAVHIHMASLVASILLLYTFGHHISIGFYIIAGLISKGIQSLFI